MILLLILESGEFMKKEFITSDIKFVFSKDELGYQEILDEIPKAKEITIITYNISERKHYLMDCLKKANDSCTISIITNIPKRWDAYYTKYYRENAKKQIKLYMIKLNPDQIGNRASIFFDFSNHGKIIMTDQIAYIGSENYSEESQTNTEFGFISKDINFIKYLKDEVLTEIKENSIPYYEYDFTELLLEATLIISALFNAKNCLYEEVYFLHDDIDGEWRYYNDTESTLSLRTLENIKEVIGASCQIASDIYDAIDTVTDSDENKTDTANELYEQLLEISHELEKLIFSDSVYQLAVFETNKYIDNLLQTKYAIEAYEDNLEDCIDKALDDALGELSTLAHAAHEELDHTFELIDNFKNTYSKLIGFFKRYHKKINQEIDNT